jgi:phosphoribosylglycinamide formyltransferase 1
MNSNAPSESSQFNPLISPSLPVQIPQNAAPVKLGLMASGSGSNLEAIAQAIANRDLNAEIAVLIYNQPDIKAAERADRWQIPKVLLNHRDFASREALDQAIAQTMRDSGVDWIIMAGWMRIVTPVLIDAFPHRILNIHPSLLPSFAGVRAVEQAIAAGVKITGCTVHYVIPEVDSGTILMQAAVPVLPHDSPESLHARIQTQEHAIYPPAIALAIAQSFAQSSAKSLNFSEKH